MSHVCMSHVTCIIEPCHTSELVGHVTRVMSHVTRVMSHVTRVMSHVTRVMSHVTRVMSHVTRVMSHVTLVMSHVTRVMSHVTCSKKTDWVARMKDEIRFVTPVTSRLCRLDCLCHSVCVS